MLPPNAVIQQHPCSDSTRANRRVMRDFKLLPKCFDCVWGGDFCRYKGEWQMQFNQCLILVHLVSDGETDCRYILSHDPKTARFDYRAEEALPVFPQNIRLAERPDVTAKKVWIYQVIFIVVDYTCDVASLRTDPGAHSKARVGSHESTWSDSPPQGSGDTGHVWRVDIIYTFRYAQLTSTYRQLCNRVVFPVLATSCLWMGSLQWLYFVYVSK